MVIINIHTVETTTISLEYSRRENKHSFLSIYGGRLVAVLCSDRRGGRGLCTHSNPEKMFRRQSVITSKILSLILNSRTHVRFVLKL